jgi:hypothetical protein
MIPLFNLKRKSQFKKGLSKIAGKNQAVLLIVAGVILVGVGSAILFTHHGGFFSVTYDASKASVASVATSGSSTITDIVPPRFPPLDTMLYDKKLEELANYPAIKLNISSTTSTTTAAALRAAASSTLAKRIWPVKTVYPNAGAILPFKRIVSYYGNFYSKGMGVLGQYPRDEVISKLKVEVDKWNVADPTTPVVPAFNYIAITAQGSPGADGMYRLRMPDSQIDKALDMAKEVNGIVFIEMQVGFSTIQKELPLLDTYWKMDNVHIALDPEFSMKHGIRPGKEIGTMDAADINYAAAYIAKIVRDNNLPPKVMLVHRFTEDMVTNYKLIKPLPEVQIVMVMDGWGFPAKKKNTYYQVIQPEPVQFTGFKLFYKNDLLPPSTALLTPDDLLKLQPRPSYIQFQ